MTFSASVPNGAQSPGLFPGQAQTNWSRIKTIIDTEHVFNDTAAANDGAHKQMSLVARIDPVALPAGTNGILYAKTVGAVARVFYYDGTAAITPVTTIRAMVNFNGTGAVGVQTMRSQFNVASVTKTATGAYTITFTTALPDANYVATITGMLSAGSFCIGQVATNAVYGNSVSTTTLKIQFLDILLATDVLMGNVLIQSVT